MRISFLLALILAPVTAFSNARILSKWAVDVGKHETPIERRMAAGLYGVTPYGKYFFVATPQGKLEKRFFETGEAEWSTPLEGASQGTWTVYNGDVFGGDTRGNFYCVDAKTGAIKWKNTTKGVFYSKPLVSADQVWVMTSNGTLQSYDRVSGQWLWQQTDPQAVTLSLWSSESPIEFQGHILAGFPSALLQAFEPKSGKLSWKESFAASVVHDLESFNDLKSITTNAEYLAASSFSGDMKVWKAQSGAKKLLWQKKISLYAPVLLDKEGLVILSSRDGSVQALELETGFVKWKHELSSGLGTQPVVFGNRVWIATSGGQVYVFSHSGELLAKTESYESSIWTPPIPASEDEALVLTSMGILRRLHILPW